MALTDDGMDGWNLNQINTGPPYVVDMVGPYRLPQVCDERMVVALSGPHGAVFCETQEQAQALCEMANAGLLEKS